MRIVLHAGLHKSGTTTVQNEWSAAFGDRGPVWYPTDRHQRLPAHHGAVWPLLDAFKRREAADLVWSATRFSGAARRLPVLIRQAASAGVDVLLISSEELDRLGPSDVPRFRRHLAGHDVVTLLTATRPMHRWASGWQTLVKHGLAEYPREAERHLLRFATLEPGRLAELSTLLPSVRRVVRLVRTEPPEASLPRDLAEAVGVAWPEGLAVGSAKNVSVGTEVEVLRRANRADLSLGTLHGRGRRILRKVEESGPSYREDPALAAAYAPTPRLVAAAEAEHAFLTTGAEAEGVEVHDPHGLLAGWTRMDPPTWYQEISQRERVVPDLPELDSPAELSELLWRVRQERSALASQLQEAEEELAAIRARHPDDQAPHLLRPSVIGARRSRAGRRDR